MADWDVVGQAPAQLQNPWAVKSNAPAPTTAGDVAKGVGYAALSGASKVATGMVGAPIALVNRLIAAATGGDGQLAADAAHEYVNRTFGHDTQTPVGKAIGAAVSNMVAPLAQSGQQDKQLLEQAGQKVGLPAGAVSNQLSEAGDIAGTAGLAAPIAAGAEASNAAEAAAAAASPAARLGLRTAGGLPAKMAGSTAGPVLDAQNNRVASSVLGADVGVPHSSPVTPQTLAAAREAPGQVLDAGYSQIQPGPLSPAAQAQVTAARGPATITKPTPNVTNQINDIESSLLDPNGQFTGEQLRATRNSLSSDANAGRNSADADTRAVAQYKANVVNALDQHLADSLPPGGTVTPDMVQNARATLAKNYQLQDLIGKGGDIDLQALAKLHRDNPNLLTGNTRTVAQFASDHPEVTGAISDANRISPPSFIGDVAGINPLKPLGTIGQAMFGAAGRRLLTGAPGEAIGSAMQAPVAGLAGEFDTAPVAGPSAAPAPSPPAGGAPLDEALNGPRMFPGQRGSLSFNDIRQTREVPGNGNENSGGASLEQANRGAGTYFTFDGDRLTPIIGDANQVDKLTPPKGSITVDGAGNLVSSGNTPRSLANGLLARLLNRRGLSDEF